MNNRAGRKGTTERRRIKAKETPEKIVKRRCNKKLDPLFTRSRRIGIYLLLRSGLPIGRVAELSSISPARLRRWIKAGKESKNLSYEAFYLQTKRIEARNEKEALKVIRKVARGKYRIKETKITTGGKHGREVVKITREKAPVWQASAWFLERRYRDYNNTIQKEEVSSVEDTARELHKAIQQMDDSVPSKK